MDNKLYIQCYSHIGNNGIYINGVKKFENKNVDFLTFAKSAYKFFNTDYPKFFKMDSLSKLAFLAAEVLLNSASATAGENENIALVLSNRASSLDTDRQHQESIQDKNNFYPSPAIFVYTLPNICMGEISIRHKLYSENSFFIFDDFNATYLHDYSNSLIADGKAEKVLCGWVDFDEANYEAFLYLTCKSGAIVHQTEAIKRLYQEPWEI